MLDKIVKYKMVNVDCVDKYLEEGWELYGNPVRSGTYDARQAMVIREEIKNSKGFTTEGGK